MEQLNTPQVHQTMKKVTSEGDLSNAETTFTNGENESYEIEETQEENQEKSNIPQIRDKRVRKRGLKYDKVTEFQKQLVVKDIYVNKLTFKESARKAGVKVSTAKTIISRFKASNMSVQEFLNQKCEKELSDFYRRDTAVNEILDYTSSLSKNFYTKQQADYCLLQMQMNQKKIESMMAAMQYYRVIMANGQNTENTIQNIQNVQNQESHQPLTE